MPAERCCSTVRASTRCGVGANALLDQRGLVRRRARAKMMSSAAASCANTLDAQVAAVVAARLRTRRRAGVRQRRDLVVDDAVQPPAQRRARSPSAALSRARRPCARKSPSRRRSMCSRERRMTPSILNVAPRGEPLYSRPHCFTPVGVGGLTMTVSLTVRAALARLLVGLCLERFRRRGSGLHGQADGRVAAARGPRPRRRAPTVSSHAAPRRQRRPDVARRRRRRRLVHARAVGRDGPERQGHRPVRRRARCSARTAKRRRISPPRSATPKRSSATSPRCRRTASTPPSRRSTCIT